MSIELVKSFLSAIPVAFLALLTVINALGTGFTLNALTYGIDFSTRKELAKKIVLNSIFISLVVLAFGKYILLFFGLDLPIIRVGGGLLLAVMGWNMLNSNQRNDHKDVHQSPTDSYLDMAFYPFTFPVTVGPGCIAVILTLSAHRSATTSWIEELVISTGSFVGLIGACIVVYFCYVYASVIQRRLGQSGAQALNRLMSFVTFCIGLQILWAGVQGLLKPV